MYDFSSSVFSVLLGNFQKHHTSRLRTVPSVLCDVKSAINHFKRPVAYYVYVIHLQLLQLYLIKPCYKNIINTRLTYSYEV